VKSLRTALIVIGVVGFILSLLVVAVLFASDREDDPAVSTVLLLLPSWSFMGTGLFAWWRRPNNRTGAMMVLVGLTWLLVGLSLSDQPFLFGISIFTSNLAWVMLALLLLSFPSGQLESRGQRVLMALFVLDAVIFPTLSGIFSGPDLEGFDCTDCPTNPVPVYTNLDLARFFDTAASLGAVVLLSVLIAMLVRRYRAQSSVNKAAIRPVLATGAATALSIGVLVAAQTADVSDPVGQTLFTITVAVLCTVPFAFLIGLLRSRISGGEAITGLVAALGGAGEVDIRAALAEALDDPSLEFAYWLPESGQYVDARGLPVELPAEGSDRKVGQVEHNGERVAAIFYDASLADDRQLIESTGSAVALAMLNQRLAAQLRANVEELRASRARIVQTSDSARRALERNLHDGAQQHLVSMALTLRLAQEKVDSDPAVAKELLGQASADLEEATTELRELARGIHPAILTDRGLGPALGALASRSPVPVTLGDVPDLRLPGPVESAAYFVAAEALTNVARYAKADGAEVTVTRANGLATIAISDDGIGGADINGGTGLRGLQDRVAALDGKLLIDSGPGGTTIRAEFPCA
jgi:signal transduction histidine kinase